MVFHADRMVDRWAIGVGIPVEFFIGIYFYFFLVKFFFPALPIREPFLCFSFISLEGDADL